jgi:ferrous iron transport protein B
MATCHTSSDSDPIGGLSGAGSSLLALIGQPNVGKSALFKRLTGSLAEIANYPGTTVEVHRAPSRTDPDLMVMDTPGLVSLPSISEDERVTAQVLLREPLRGIVQVGDSKHLRRTLLLTSHLLEMGSPVVLALNMTDEAENLGLVVDYDALEHWLGVPVVPTQAVRGEGVTELLAAVSKARSPVPKVVYPPVVERAVRDLVGLIPQGSRAARALGVLWLSQDAAADEWLHQRLPSEGLAKALEIREEAQRAFDEPLEDVILHARLAFADRLTGIVCRDPGALAIGWGERLGRWAIHPFWGLAILALVMLAMFGIVGVFGAGMLVTWLEGGLFGGLINPWVGRWIQGIFGSGWITDLLVGPYGLWTMGITYAAALILPIVTTFFLAFGALEDSGYVPRLSVLTNRWFERMGLNGKAVLPMVLGLGCVTMATLTTRILETRRERTLAILLLALAVPCSAQLGVVMGMLASVSAGAVVVWGLVVLGVMLAVGWLSSRLMPGSPSPLMLELPPLRLPERRLLLAKTAARLEWYAREVVPLFLLGSLVMFLLDRSGVLESIVRAGRPLVVGWLGLPPQATTALVLGFFRRDFGAAGLYALQAHGLMSPLQVLVAMVTITLFVPCVASVLMIVKERGWRTTVALLAFIFPLAIAVGGGLRVILLAFGWGA